MPGFLVPATSRTLAPAIAAGLQRGGVIARLRDVRGQIFVWWDDASKTPLVRRVLHGLTAAGVLTGALSILDALPGIDLPAISTSFGGNDVAHPGQVVKSWTANGVAFVRLGDGRMGAFSAKRGTWKYWRPKKPIVVYSSGSSDLKTLLRADKAAERQLRRLKKAVDRRFPKRAPAARRRTDATTIIQESGSGGVQKSLL